MWKLLSGNLSDTCTFPVWDGQASVRGWYQYEESYGGEKNWYLHLLSDDLLKLPAESYLGKSFREDPSGIWNPQFKFRHADQALIERLKDGSPDDPVEMTIKGYGEYCEGPAFISVSSGKELP